MRSKQVPRANCSPRRDCPDWLRPPTQAQQDRDRQAARLRTVIQFLEANAGRLNRREPPRLEVHAILPDDDDPLESMEQTPATEVEFPVSSEEFWTTWRIGLEREPVVDHGTLNLVFDS